MDNLNDTFASVNDEDSPDTPAPTTPLRSGGPESLVSWASLGHQGRIFVAGGPTVDELTEVQRRPRHRTDPGLRRDWTRPTASGRPPSWPRASCSAPAG